jgi:hypothetical protein
MQQGKSTNPETGVDCALAALSEEAFIDMGLIMSYTSSGIQKLPLGSHTPSNNRHGFPYVLHAGYTAIYTDSTEG